MIRLGLERAGLLLVTLTLCLALGGCSSFPDQFVTIRGNNNMFVRYVAPTVIGTGDGKTKETAALYTDEAFWARVKTSLADHRVTVEFLAGRYSAGPLVLRSIGDATNCLTLQGTYDNESVFDAGSDPERPGVTGLSLRQCSNITIRSLVFTGKGKLSFAAHCLESSNVLFESCSWFDLPNVKYGATGSSGIVDGQPDEVDLSPAHHIAFRNCAFKSVGTTPGAHMIYNAYSSRHVRVIDCNFEDCAGEYVRFRDLTDYGVVSGCTFRSTGTYPPHNPMHLCSISVPLYSDADPGDEWFGTHFFFANNRFLYEGVEEDSPKPIPIRFAHRGFNPPGFSYLLTAEEGELLENGTAQERKKLLLENTGIDVDEVHIFANEYVGADRKATFYSKPDFGAKSKGWRGSVDIFDLLNHEPISLEDWLAETDTVK